MRIVIDGYNLIHQHPNLTRLTKLGFEAARERLIEDLNSFNNDRRHRIYCVFDGREGLSKQETRTIKGSINVVYSAIGQSADEVIKAMAHEAGANLLVVTSDREIAQYVARKGSAVLSSPEFAHLLLFPPPPDPEALAGEEAEEDLSERKTGKKKGPARRKSDRAKKIQLALGKL